MERGGTKREEYTKKRAQTQAAMPYQGLSISNCIQQCNAQYHPRTRPRYDIQYVHPLYVLYLMQLDGSSVEVDEYVAYL